MIFLACRNVSCYCGFVYSRVERQLAEAKKLREEEEARKVRGLVFLSMVDFSRFLFAMTWQALHVGEMSWQYLARWM